MKFTLALLSASFASLPFAVADGHFSWNYSAKLNDAGDVSSPDCISAFDAAYVAAWNEVNSGGDVLAESCTVNAATPEFVDTLSVGNLGGTYNYNGGADYR